MTGWVGKSALVNLPEEDVTSKNNACNVILRLWFATVAAASAAVEALAEAEQEDGAKAAAKVKVVEQEEEDWK